MARLDPLPGSGRLATVLGPPRPPWPGLSRAGEPVPTGVPERRPSSPDDPPTEPLAAVADLVVEGDLAPPGVVARLLRRLVPEAWRGARLNPGRPGATALALVAAAAAVLAAVGVWSERPQAEPVPGLPAVSVSGPTAEPLAPGGTAPESPAGSGASTAAGPTPPPGGELVVSVSGKVQHPGLVTVAGGARVADVLDAAGGALPGTDLAGLNLARRVADGEQIAVGVPAAPEAAPVGAGPTGAGASTRPGGKIDLNAATEAQLDTLPGVGPVMAQRILEWRTRNGRFARVDQLREIEGIGERRFAQLRELVTV